MINWEQYKWKTNSKRYMYPSLQQQCLQQPKRGSKLNVLNRGIDKEVVLGRVWGCGCVTEYYSAVSERMT